MLPVDPSANIQEQNPTLRVMRFDSPEGVPEEECGSLKALVGTYQQGVFDGGTVIKTFWKPSEEEIAALKAGAVIELDFYGVSGMPMTAMNVEYI